MGEAEEVQEITLLSHLTEPHQLPLYTMVKRRKVRRNTEKKETLHQLE